ncbi:TPA: hypothetical protein ACWKR9_005892 [Escherichia coli]|uniref:hypothetical protein n=1 Tax=Escherichia coli TaxID=562 RepID=UPI0014831DB3|nr:hypothetical protein [Escherichia coli]
MKQQNAALHAADAASVNLSQNKKPTNLVVKKSKSCNGVTFLVSLFVCWFIGLLCIMNAQSPEQEQVYASSNI